MIATRAARYELATMAAPVCTPAQHNWLLLHLAAGVGGCTVAKLLQKFSGVEAALGASESELKACGLPNLQEILNQPDLPVRLDQLLADLAQQPEVRLVTPDDKEYPALLRKAHTVPPVLFVIGQLRAQPAVAVVGSRRVHPDRARLTSEWCREWAEAGISVVSGLAEGTDAAAHRGALAGQGHTVAVLGTGPDKTYPSTHVALQNEILDCGGAVVSQFAPGTPGFPGSFPARNHTLAGLADAVVIMQAGADSGSLYTAKAARDSERPVLVAPSNPGDRDNAGGLELLRQGARVLVSPADLFEVLKQQPRSRELTPEPLLPDELTKVLSQLDFTGQPLDELTRQLQLPAAVVLDRLLALELAGLVARRPGSCYVRIR